LNFWPTRQVKKSKKQLENKVLNTNIKIERSYAGGLAFTFEKPSALQVDWLILKWKIVLISPPLTVGLKTEFGSASIIFD